MSGSAPSGRNSGAQRRNLAVSRPRLFEILAGAERVAVISAPAGSGKTFLVRSWIAEAGLGQSAAGSPWNARSPIRRASGCRWSARYAELPPDRSSPGG